MAASKYLLWTVCLGSLLATAFGARILGIFPVPGKSHMIFVSSLARELARRNHDVTVVSTFPQEKPLPHYTDIVVDNTMEEVGTMDMFSFHDGSPALMMWTMWQFGQGSCKKLVAQPSIQKLIHSKDVQFDLLIVEHFFSECLIGFANVFKAPVIQLCAFVGSSWMLDITGNTSPYSYVPSPFLNYGDHMTFSERLKNTLFELYATVGYNLYYIPRQDAIMREGFNDSSMPYLSDLSRNTAIMFVNSHVSVNTPRPMVPNVIEVGGMHISPPKRLPKELQTFLDEATDGVIYFSMGSVLQGSNLPEAKRKAFIEAFSKLKQKVLWKWETDKMPGKPDNLRLEKWLPQSDVLAHKNVRLFITHGGLLSTQEAIYHGVPVVGIPIYGDQQFNMARTEAAGTGIKISYENITAESVYWAIQEVLNQPSYREKSKQLSVLFRDRQQNPLEVAVFWTEYVIRHKGAPHLRSASLDLSWYQYLLLDVVGLLLGAFVVCVWIAYVVLRLLWRKGTQTKPGSIVESKKGK